MPRYELDGEAWEIVHDGKQLALVAGGKATTRKFVSPEHAALQYAKLIAEKEAAGWRRVAGGAIATSGFGEPREPTLEQHIINNLDDREAYSVYADWYQTQQHPRGELIALQLAEETRGEDRKLHEAVAKHLARYKVELLGPLARHVAPNGESPLIWRNGFIQGLFFEGDDPPADVIRDVVKHPSGRLLSSIQLQLHDYEAIREALVAVAPAAPTLRDVLIMTGASLGGLELLEQLPRLRTLSLATLSQESVRGHALHELTKISTTCEGLHLRFDEQLYLRDLLPLFVRDDLAIRELSMRVPAYIDPILTAIAEGPFAKHVEKLDFALTDPDAGVRAFVANRERFVKLREVTASIDRLTLDARNMLKAHYKVTDVREDHLAEQIGYDEDYYDEVGE